MMSTRTTLPLLLAFLAAACGGEPAEPTSPGESGAETVVDPVGTTTHLDPAHPEPIDELAETLTETHDRVDLGDSFAREAIGGEPGRRLTVDGSVVETWTFDTEAEAHAFAGRFSNDGRLFDGERLPWLETTHIYTFGPMVLMYLGDEARTLTSLGVVAEEVTAHAGTEVAGVLTADEIEERVREEALARFAFGGDEPLRLVEKEEVVFPDACLGVEGTSENCNEVETPGWRLTFAHGDDRIIAHTDAGAARIYWPSDR